MLDSPVSSHLAPAAPPVAASLALSAPSAAFLTREVVDFLGRNHRLAQLRPPCFAATAPATSMPPAPATPDEPTAGEYQLEPLADPTLEAIEEPPPAPTVEDLLFAPLDLATLDPSIVASHCFGGGEAAANDGANDWSEAGGSESLAGCVATSNTAVHEAPAEESDDDGELLLVETDDAETGETTYFDIAPPDDEDHDAALADADEATTSGEFVAAPSPSESGASDDLPTLELIEDEPVASTAAVDELPTLELVEEDATAVAVLDEEPPVSDEPEATEPEAAATETEADEDPAVATSWAAVQAPIDPAPAVPPAVVATAPATAPETTIAPAASVETHDLGIEQVQHHVLTALEQVQSNLGAALDQLRAATPPDLSPALQALREQLDRQGEAFAAHVATVRQMSERIDALGAAIAATTPVASAAPAAAAPTPTAATTTVAVDRDEPTSLRVPLALAGLGATWAVLLWCKTGSATLAVGTLVGVNLVAGMMLAFGRGRD